MTETGYFMREAVGLMMGASPLAKYCVVKVLKVIVALKVPGYGVTSF